MTATKEWRRVGNKSGPCNLYRSRYLIKPHQGWHITDLQTGERIYGRFDTLRDAALYIEANRQQFPA